jgi:spermidine synthase
MSESAVLPKPAQAQAATATAPLAGVALVSFAALLLELALTRLFSVVLFYHFAFLAISIALLGLGAGGVFAYLRQHWLAPHDVRKIGGLLCLINAVAIVLTLEVVLHTRVALQLSSYNFKRLTAIYLFSAIPFFFTGLLFSVAFARETRRIPQLYGADLVGGSLACLAVVPLLNWIGGPNTVVFAGLAMAVGAVTWAPSRRGRRAGVVLALVFAALIAANYSGRLMDVIYAKGVRISDYFTVEYVRWNAISRIEVDRKKDGSKWVVIDADANSAIMNFDPRVWEQTPLHRAMMSTAPSVTNVLRPHGSYAIIGPGGGPDVMRALANGSSNITGIEINPIIINNVMRGRYADYSHHLYDLPQVHIHIADGRSWVRNSRQRYDVIQMTLVDTWASTAAGAFALSENNLYTVEAFKEYFQHLNPDGMIAITRWEFKEPREALRVLAVAIQALHEIGVANPARNFIVVSEGALNVDGRPVVVLAKKTPFTAEEEAAVQAHLAETRLVAQYMPSQPQDNAFGELIASNDPYGFAQNYKFNVTPVTDNAPFFFFTLKTRQILNKQLLARGIDWKVNLGVVVLAMVLLISIAAVLFFLVLPLALHGGGGGQTLQLLYFVAVGLGYILVEITFIQRFVLFLGNPTYALTVVIFLLMLSSGAGSMVSRRWLSQPSQVKIPLVAIVAALLVYVGVLHHLLGSLVGLPFFLKLVISAAVLIPLGFAMGMPFPTGLRWLAGEKVEAEDATIAPADGAPAQRKVVEWAWAMNAASSVLGSVLAIVIAIHVGLNLTLSCGALAYLLALLLTVTFRRTPLSRGA